MSEEIIIDAKNTLFCCGPCNSIDIEPEPIYFNNNTEKYYLYKPHTGGRYPGYSWKLTNNKTLFVKNIRVCHNCFFKYNECSGDANKNFNNDGDKVLEKFNKFNNY
jgi:hypothetical protein